MHISLQWAPISHYTSLAALDQELDWDKKVNRSGIYIWGFKDDNGLFWPYYVGKHRNLPFRLCEHACNLKGGSYTLYSEAELFSSNDIKCYEPHKLGDKVDLLEGKRPDLQKNIDNMLSRFHYTYVLIDDFDQQGEEFEYAVINKIKRDFLSNKRGRKPKDPVDIGNLNEIIHEQFIMAE